MLFFFFCKGDILERSCVGYTHTHTHTHTIYLKKRNLSMKNWIFFYIIMVSFAANARTIFFLSGYFLFLERNRIYCHSTASGRKWAKWVDVWRSRSYKTNEANHRYQMPATGWLTGVIGRGQIPQTASKHDFSKNMTTNYLGQGNRSSCI
jgi:hypothetical protein